APHRGRARRPAEGHGARLKGAAPGWSAGRPAGGHGARLKGAAPGRRARRPAGAGRLPLASPDRSWVYGRKWASSTFSGSGRTTCPLEVRSPVRVRGVGWVVAAPAGAGLAAAADGAALAGSSKELAC